jgi:2'-5' RNA ligase
MNRAIASMISTDPTHVRSHLTWPQYHCSINYFCCHTPAEHDTIKKILHTISWQPFNLTFSGVDCNRGPGENWCSLYSTVNDEGQTLLMNFARRIEAAMVAAGVPNNHPRQQEFHATLGQTTLDYPNDEFRASINATIPVFNPTMPITVQWFLDGDDPGSQVVYPHP